MAGIKLLIKATGIEAVERRLRDLAAGGRDMKLTMGSIGEYLVRTTRDRFHDEEAPDGTPWAPLRETTKRRKQRNVGKILTEEGHLQMVVLQADSDSVEVGSPYIYAGTHQFGAERGAFGATRRGSPIPWGDIPARPFLGLSDADRNEIEDIVREHFIARIQG